MKTAISVPDAVLRRADQFARRRKMSRSALFTQAMEEFLARRERRRVAEQLERAHRDVDSSLDPVLDEMQRRTLFTEEW
ncbi:MAG: ChpI protein [Candidatus Sumerlaeia bacterium]|nr:ChpI protein [Candidatus Sumerlaeia bacterium]